MRFHRAFAELAMSVGAPLADVAAPETLVAARYEPALRGNKASGVVDLHFRREAKRTVVPLLLVDVAMLEARERDPLVWPSFARSSGIDDFSIAQRVLEWLKELLDERRLTAEAWKVFGDETDSGAFDMARTAGFLGAAPLEDVARRAAPFIFARRHARARDVAIACRDGALGAALLDDVARRVRLETEDAAGLAWYAPTLADAEPEIAIVDASHRDNPYAASCRVVIDLDEGEAEGLRVEPAPFVPLDVLFDFSGSVRREMPGFCVRAKSKRDDARPVLPEEEPIGGSTGRILFVLRRGARRFGGADVDYAETIAAAMRDEGFTVAVVDDLHDAREFAPDLVHAFGVADASQSVACARMAASLEIPFAIHPFYDAPGIGGYWGATVTPYCYRFMQDETSIEQLVTLMRDRRLALNSIVATTPFHPTNAQWEADVRTALTAADIVYAAGPAEEEALRAYAPGANVLKLAPPIAPVLTEPRSIDALVGSEPYVLLHAPIESTQNQLQAVRAAQLADLTLVIAGPVADADYAAVVRSFAGDRTLLVGDPDAALLEGLYRGAEVFLDAAWVGLGPARAAIAFSRGAALAISSRSHPADLGLGEFLCEVDPGDVEGMARGLGDAWYRRREEPKAFDAARRDFAARAGVREVTRAVVGGYAGALERRNLLVLR